MSVRKHNEYLEDGASEDDVENGYDSDAAEESRGAITGRSRKRRRLDEASDEDSLDGIHDERRDTHTENVHPTYEAQGDVRRDLSHDSDAPESAIDRNSSGASLKPSTPKQVAAAQKAARRSGVVYISRVPPFMKPQTLKHFLAPYASKGLGRIFLTPEDHEAHTRRVKSGGNKKKTYTDGWVEFTSKREAKTAVQILNGNIIGGKKGNFYHDDLWSMKYLKGFKWSHLTEQIANENAERAARMREEVRKTRQENKAFVENVERGKMLENMEAKRQTRGDVSATAPLRLDGRSTKFKQKKAQGTGRNEMPSQQATRLQSMIF